MKKQFFLSLLSVLLFTLTLPPISWGLFRWIVFIPIFFIIADKNIQRKEKIWYIWSFGFIVLLAQYSIFWDLFPLTWLGIESLFISFLIILAIWIFLTLFISLSFFILSFSTYSIYLFPILWVLVEYSRSWLYSVFVWGRSSTLGDNFSYGFLAFSTNTSELLLSMTPVLGIYGFSFLIALANVFLFKLIIKFKEKADYKKIIGALVITLVFLFIEYFPQSEILAKNNLSNEPKTISVISLQGDNPFLFGYDSDYFDTLAEKYKLGIKNALLESPDADLIVLPEATSFIKTLQKEKGGSAREIAQDLLGTERERIIVYGDYDEIKDVSRIHILSNMPLGADTYLQKDALMPLGEYQPYLVEFFAWLFGQDKWWDEVTYYRDLDNVETKSKSVDTGIGRIAALACSEILSINEYRDVVGDDPDIILHLQRLAAFKTDRVYKMMLAVSQFRAAELRKPIIGSVDGGGVSYVIDSYGRIIANGKDDDTYITSEITF